MIIDSHCHINDNQFGQDIEIVIQNAISAGVKKIFVPNVNLESLEKIFPIQQQFPEIIYPMLGLHPCEVGSDFQLILNKLYKNIEKTKFYAIGEIGLDYFWDKTHIEAQKECFEIQINWALDHQLPINIHSREATEDAILLVKKYVPKGLKGIFHCFLGSVEQAKKIVDLGFYLGIGGVVTYKNSNLATILAEIGLDNIILETDAPYLPPVPHRGKRNEPSFLPFVIDKIADATQFSMLEVKNITSQNALKIYNLL